MNFMVCKLHLKKEGRSPTPQIQSFFLEATNVIYFLDTIPEIDSGHTNMHLCMYKSLLKTEIRV